MQHWECERCGTVGTRRPARGQRPRWCSDKCRYEARAERMGSRQCERCGIDFLSQDSRAKFCSRECSAAEQSRVRRQPKQSKPPRVPPDRRSPLRRAIEDRDAEAMRAALLPRTMQVGECWEWLGQLKDGYPVMAWGRRRGVAVHRAVVEVICGAPLGVQAAHHACGNSRCVNPDHLQPVTHADNIAEMLARSAYVQRIEELEAALAEVSPHHPTLNRVRLAS